MRKIEQQMLSAIINKRNFKSGNTRVEYFPEIVKPVFAQIEMAKVYLHNNHIATFAYFRSEVYINDVTLMEYPSRTTFSRLRALGVRPELELKKARATFEHGVRNLMIAASQDLRGTA